MGFLLRRWKPYHKFTKALRFIAKIIAFIILINFLVLPFCVLPENISRIFKWFWLGCAFVNLDNFAEYKTAREQKIVCPITALYIILILVYLYTYWHFLSLPIVICGSIIIGIIEFTISISIYKTVRFTDKQKLVELPSKMIHGIQLGGLYICSLALFLLGIFESTLLLYIFGGIALLLLAVSILMSLSSGLSVKNNVFNLIAFVVDVLSFLALVIYLIYVIPKEFANLQSIITTMVAAVLGGALTLAGVAWTIKKSDKDRREEERKKCKPFLIALNYYDDDAGSKGSLDTLFCEDDNFHGKKLILYGNIKNISESIAVFTKIIIANKTFKVQTNAILEKGKPCQIIVNSSDNLYNDTAELYIEDILGNQYVYIVYCILANDGKRANFNEIREISNHGQI